jgi:chaperone modulatory protein CbpM
MTLEINAVSLEDTVFGLDELARSCHVSREWIIERVQWGLVPNGDLTGTAPEIWQFDSRSFLRIKRIVMIERDFEGNPELAGLVADLIEEVESLRARLHATGLPED